MERGDKAIDCILPIRVLVIDDDVDLLEVLDQILSARGFEVLCASSGFMVDYTAEDFAPEVVLLDINMPELDGFEVLRHLQECLSNENVPVVAMTSLKPEQIGNFGDPGMFSRVARKPLDFRTLPETLKELVRG